MFLNMILINHFSCRVRKLRNDSAETGIPLLFINAGDTYTGTPWFTVYKDEIATKFVNMLKPDVIVSIIYYLHYILLILCRLPSESEKVLFLARALLGDKAMTG